MASLDDLLRFILNPPPGDASLTAQRDQIPVSVVNVTAPAPTDGFVATADHTKQGGWGWEAGGGGASSRPSAMIDLKLDYGAKFDGVTDDTAAWQAAINAVKAAGGGAWLHVPPLGTSIISSTIDCTRLFGCTISARSAGGYEATNCEVRFTGTTLPMFAFYGADGILIDGIKFTYYGPTADLAGDLIAFDWPLSGGGADCIYNHIQNCAFVGIGGGGGYPHTLLRFNRSVIATVRDCHFSGATNAIMLGNDANPPAPTQTNDYINVAQIQGCAFNSCTWSYVNLYGYDMEAITIRDCTFEGCPGQKPLASPTGFTATPVAGGGTFAPGTYYWRVTGLNARGETLSSSEATATVAASGHANLAWSAVTGANGYNIYRATSPSGEFTPPAFLATIGSGAIVTYTDTGAAVTAGQAPSYNTTGGGGAISAPIPRNAVFGMTVNIEDCWFGDASGNGIPWINNVGTGGSFGPSRIVGCSLFGNGLVSDPAISVDGYWTLEGNYLEQPISSGSSAGTTWESMSLIGNEYNMAGPAIVALPAAWQTRQGTTYTAPIPNGSVADGSAQAQFSTFPTNILGGMGLQTTAVYGNAVNRYLGTITTGPPTDNRMHSNLYDWYGPDANGHFWMCTAGGTPGTFIRDDHGTIATPTYSASITPNVQTGRWQTITVTNNSAFTINAPTSGPSSTTTEVLTVEVLNSSGGAMGVITWNGAFLFAGFTWANPASTKHRFARFEWNGTSWIATAIATADY